MNISLNKDLLSIIIAIQSKKQFSINESILGLDNSEDWLQVVQDYYYNLPDDLVHNNGLKKNQYCFDALLNFNLTPYIMKTKSSKLGNFEFKY